MGEIKSQPPRYPPPSAFLEIENTRQLSSGGTPKEHHVVPNTHVYGGAETTDRKLGAADA